MDIGMISSHLSNQGTVKFGNLRQWLLDQSLSRQQANALIGQLFALDLVLQPHWVHYAILTARQMPPHVVG
jgi:hypothetical protein